MKFHPPQQDIVLYETGFSNNSLERQRISKKLSEVLERIEDPLVVAIDGKWGTGKSYFLKRWVGAHRIENGGKAQTIYFDAFENDYISDPLVSLVQVIEGRLLKQPKKSFDRIKKAAYTLGRPLARAGLAVASLGASEVLNNLGDAVVTAVKEETEKKIDDFWQSGANRKQAFVDFRTALESLTFKDNERLPLIIVIDEIDRCRPDYALDLIEVIKHFFSVSYVHFVFGVNLSALQQMVRVRYGQAIDAAAYLQKFVNINISLPDYTGDFHLTPVVIEYARKSGREMGIPDFLIKELEDQLEALNPSFKFSFRDVERILSQVTILPQKYIDNNYSPLWREFIINLIVIKISRKEIYEKLLSMNTNKEELEIIFGLKFEVEIDIISENPRLRSRAIRKLVELCKIWLFLLNIKTKLTPAEERKFSASFYDDVVENGTDFLNHIRLRILNW